MELQAVGVAIGASRAAIGRFHEVPDREEALVRLAQSRSSFGSSSFRSSMYFDERSGEWHAGDPAWTLAFHERNTGLFVRSPVPYLSINGHLAWKGTTALRQGEGKQPLSVPWLLGRLLRALADELERQAPGDSIVCPIVIAAPLFRTTDWMAPLREACAFARLDLLDVISEPEAILSSYLFSRKTRGEPDSAVEPGQSVLILNWGSETFQLATVRLTSRMADTYDFELLATAYASGIGGRHIDDLIVRFLGRKYASDIRRPAYARQTAKGLIKDIEEAKAELSNAGDTEASWLVGLPTTKGQDRVPFCYDDLIQVLQQRTMPTLSSVVETVHHACERIREWGGPVDRVLLAGGSSNLPLCQPSIRAVFGEHAVIERRAQDHLPDEAVIRGAVLRAAQLQGRRLAGRMVRLTVPSTPKHDIGILVRGHARDQFLSIVPAGTRLPAGQAMTREVRVKSEGNVLLTCVEHIIDQPYEVLLPHYNQLASLNLGPLPVGTRVDVRLSSLSRAVEDPVTDCIPMQLSVSYANKLIGPLRIDVRSV